VRYLVQRVSPSRVDSGVGELTEDTVPDGALTRSSLVRAITFPARRVARPAIERSVGLLPFFEARNRMVAMRPARRVLELENAEVAFHACRLGEQSSFNVATVIATYRRPQLVVAAVTSALAQTEEDHVVIVVSDGEDLPMLPTHDRLIPVRLRKHIGVLGAVRNVGIRLSRSRYLAFLDDDNRWLPEHLTDCLSVLDRGERFVYSGITRVLPDGSRYDQVSVPFDRHRLRNENFVDANAIVVRREPGTLFSRIPRPRGLLPPEDWEFVWRLTKHGATLVERPSVEYLINPESNFYPHFYRDALRVVAARAREQA
jgi:Glycosyl transferase family 2